MIPIPGLYQVKVAWIVLEKQGFLLYGFLLYTDADRGVVDYIGDGIFDLDVLSGERCAIFVIESPSERWVTYARQTGHSWWQLFGDQVAETYSKNTPTDKSSSWFNHLITINKIVIKDSKNVTAFIDDGNQVSLSQPVSKIRCFGRRTGPEFTIIVEGMQTP